jgi:hypothetical protein
VKTARDCAAAGIPWRAGRRAIALRPAAAHLTIRRVLLCVLGVRFTDSPPSVPGTAPRRRQLTTPAAVSAPNPPRSPRADPRQIDKVMPAAATPNQGRHAGASIGVRGQRTRESQRLGHRRLTACNRAPHTAVTWSCAARPAPDTAAPCAATPRPSRPSASTASSKEPRPPARAAVHRVARRHARRRNTGQSHCALADSSTARPA